MKTKRSRRFIQMCSMLSGVAMFLFVGQAHAVLIDTFDEDQGPVAVNGNGITKFDTVVGGGIIGGERDLAVTCNSGCNSFDGLKAGANASSYVHSQDNNVGGKSRITWDGMDGIGDDLDADGLGGVDFTDGGSEIGLFYKILNQDVGAELTFFAYTDAGNYSKLVVPHAPTTDEDFVALYSDFMIEAGAGVDFTNVGALVLLVESTDKSLDLSLDFIRTTGGDECEQDCIPTEMPEPGTWLLFATGLIGIVGYGWRRNKSIA